MRPFPASRILPAVALSLAASLALRFPPAAAAADDADLAARIDAYAAPFVADRQLSGTLLVCRGDETLYERSWGFASRELGVPNGPDTRFCIASVTKPMTIAVVCRLAEEGKLSPEDTVARWIPDFPRGEELTVSHVLNHRACIPHRVTTPEQETTLHTAADMVELVKEKGLLPLEPGERSIYSSAGYCVLARIVELASGMSYGEALRHYLCEPAGMEHTGHFDARTVVPDRACGYFSSADGPVNAPLQDLSFLVGAGSVVSTPRDLHRMIRAVVDGTLGPVVPVALMREHGLSWNGVTNGFRAFAEYDKDTDIEIIFTGNLLTGAADAIQRDVPRIVAGEEVAPPPRRSEVFVDVAEDALRRLEGSYRSDSDKEHVAVVDHGELYFGQWPLLPLSPTSFFSPQDYARVEVVTGDDGAVERFDWIRPDGTYPWRRTGDAESVAASR